MSHNKLSLEDLEIQMSNDEALRSRIARMEEELRLSHNQLEKNQLATLKAALAANLVPCYRFYHYYQPSNYNNGDYESYDYYFVNKPTDVIHSSAELVHISESHLATIQSKIRWN